MKTKTMQQRRQRQAEMIRDILKDSPYLPESGVYRLAADGLQRMSMTALQALHVILTIKSL